MTRPGFLDNSHVRHWLGDIEPAWTALTYESFNALQHEPSATNAALHLASDLTVNELNASAVARNALHLLRRSPSSQQISNSASQASFTLRNEKWGGSPLTSLRAGPAAPAPPKTRACA